MPLVTRPLLSTIDKKKTVGKEIKRIGEKRTIGLKIKPLLIRLLHTVIITSAGSVMLLLSILTIFIVIYLCQSEFVEVGFIYLRLASGH